MSQADKAALMQKQQGRCAKCRDMLSRWEVHHNPPVADGGDGGSAPQSGVCLVCPTCHAEETERQELRSGNQKAPQYFESQLSPDMMDMFETTPQEHFGS